MKESMKQEAIRRLQALGIVEDVIQAFKESNQVCKSEPSKMESLYIGVTYLLDESEREAVEAFEAQYQSSELKVYHVIPRYIEGEKCLTYLYVTQDDLNESYQAYFDSDLSQNIIHCYFDALKTQWFSEHGTEYIVPAMGGVVIPPVYSVEDYQKLEKFASKGDRHAR